MPTDLFSLIGELFYLVLPNGIWLAAVTYLIYGYLLWKNGISQSAGIPIILFLTFAVGVSFPDPSGLLYKLYVVAGIAQGTIIGLGVLSFVGGKSE